MSESIEKPFYFQAPWNIFFELHRLQKILPWEINISYLLSSFLEEMEKRGQIDFKASGMALDSSTTIYLMKSKLLLNLEEPLPPPKDTPEFLPPPLFLPFRYELTSTTIEHLLEVLDEVLKEEHSLPIKPRIELPIPPPEILPPVDKYLIEIENRMEKLYSFLQQLAEEERIIVFSKIIAQLEKLEAIRTFIILLFLAQQGKVSLWQDEEFTELYITFNGDSDIEGRETGID